MDPSLVSVVGVVSTETKAVQSPETSNNKEKQKKRHSTPVTKSSTDAKLEVSDQKWFERFSRLEAFMLSKSQEKSEPTFQTVKMPAKTSPASAVKVTEPFIAPIQLTDLLTDLWTDMW